MSQVTRCPSCGTRFKVVADQLRISQGWVRCGMCQSVFDASQDLQSVPDELLQQDGAEAPQKPVVPELQLKEAGEQRTPFPSHRHAGDASLTAPSFGVQETDALQHSDPVDSAAAGTQAPESAQAAQRDPDPSGPMPGVAQAPPSHVDQMRSLHEEDAAVGQQDSPQGSGEPELRVSPTPREAWMSGAAHDLEGEAQRDGVSTEALLLADIGDMHSLREGGQALADADADADQGDAAAPAGEEPGFVRQARRQAFWHSAGMRVALVLGSLVAVAGVVAQHAWQQRDGLAAQYPALAPVLAKACSLAGCELQARRAIGDVVISGSGFKQLADAHQYQWSLTLENRSDVPVAMPMAELTLTDAQDRPLLRRVIDLGPLGAPQQLHARQEWSVSVPVQVLDLDAAVAGYRALVFYP
ncbi:MAG: zinc-ribbon domain-containing protein [Comamonas sp.]|uniref:zinc-ribbon and DUF3426 domain-containing protein n=1 Tax=Comamonas sp. TaxID=34028 RepID=UPI0028450F13|nr:zinc-ribbon and DUF3426 domain-containing protein [Comamonas sp.]MDR3065706.1 zinc-ribbon domain-containing protein [Comamonas sp.]